MKFGKLILKITLLLFLSQTVFSQNPNYISKGTFEKEYVKTEYPKPIKIEFDSINNLVFIDSAKIEFSTEASPELIQIIKKGLIPPEQVFGVICCLNELPFINPNPQTRRFYFWSFPKRIENPIDKNSVDYILSTRVNPDEYILELENKNANEKTLLPDFIDGAILTYIKHRGIIL